ncbi:MAG: HD domain-containing protein [Candidatus Omnitrophica bacterium]|nr:HD domain-containing protein [Candidatus Omnitrophota bacterium]
MINAVIAFAEKCRYEKNHAMAVARHALSFFDALTERHKLGAKERLLLQSGALLHDIGFSAGADCHHKAARDMILISPDLPFGPRERVIVALIARYHRRALPAPQHKYYIDCSPEDQKLISALASFVRLSDGLDRSHRGLVSGLKIEDKGEMVEVGLVSKDPCAAELDYAVRKTDLFNAVWNVKARFFCVS